MDKIKRLTEGCIEEWFYDYSGSGKKVLCRVMDEAAYREYRKLRGVEAIRRIETCAGANYAVPVED